VPTTTRRPVRAALTSPASSQLVIDHDVVLPANTSRAANSKHSNTNLDCSAQHVTSLRPGRLHSRCRTSVLSVNERSDGDDDRLQTTSSDNVVDTTDICNCSPSFGGRQPGRHLADMTSTTSSIAAGEMRHSADVAHAATSSQV